MCDLNIAAPITVLVAGLSGWMRKTSQLDVDHVSNLSYLCYRKEEYIPLTTLKYSLTNTVLSTRNSYRHQWAIS